MTTIGVARWNPEVNAGAGDVRIEWERQNLGNVTPSRVGRVLAMVGDDNSPGEVNTPSQVFAPVWGSHDLVLGPWVESNLEVALSPKFIVLGPPVNNLYSDRYGEVRADPGVDPATLAATFTVTSGQEYVISWWSKAEGTTNASLTYTDGSSPVTVDLDGDAEWTQHSARYTPASTSLTLTLTVHEGSSSTGDEIVKLGLVSVRPVVQAGTHAVLTECSLEDGDTVCWWDTSAGGELTRDVTVSQIGDYWEVSEWVGAELDDYAHADGTCEFGDLRDSYTEIHTAQDASAALREDVIGSIGAWTSAHTSGGGILTSEAGDSPHGGYRIREVTANASGVNVRGHLVLPTTSGKRYLLRMWARALAPGGTQQIDTVSLSGFPATATQHTDWRLYQFEGVAVASSITVRAWACTTGVVGGEGIEVAGVSLREIGPMPGSHAWRPTAGNLGWWDASGLRAEAPAGLSGLVEVLPFTAQESPDTLEVDSLIDHDERGDAAGGSIAAGWNNHDSQRHAAAAIIWDTASARDERGYSIVDPENPTFGGSGATGAAEGVEQVHHSIRVRLASLSGDLWQYDTQASKEGGGIFGGSGLVSASSGGVNWALGPNQGAPGACALVVSATATERSVAHLRRIAVREVRRGIAV